MKLRVEITGSEEEEVIIRCREMTDEIEDLQRSVASLVGLSKRKGGELILSRGDEEFCVPLSEILFFETDGSRTAAHTRDAMLYTPLRLFELEEALPEYFVRGSKSCIINTLAVSSVKKNLAGASEVCFKNSIKKIYVSRHYFKQFRCVLGASRLDDASSKGAIKNEKE